MRAATVGVQHAVHHERLGRLLRHLEVAGGDGRARESYLAANMLARAGAAANIPQRLVCSRRVRSRTGHVHVLLLTQ